MQINRIWLSEYSVLLGRRWQISALLICFFTSCWSVIVLVLIWTNSDTLERLIMTRVAIGVGVYLPFLITRPVFTGWFTSDGFEFQTIWLNYYYIPLDHFVRVGTFGQRHYLKLKGLRRQYFSRPLSKLTLSNLFGSKRPYHQRLTEEIKAAIVQLKAGHHYA